MQAGNQAEVQGKAGNLACKGRQKIQAASVGRQNQARRQAGKGRQSHAGTQVVRQCLACMHTSMQTREGIQPGRQGQASKRRQSGRQAGKGR
jgi:hypothetical protein